MDLFLKILGAIFLSLLILITLAVLVLRYKLRKLMKAFTARQSPQEFVPFKNHMVLDDSPPPYFEAPNTDASAVLSAPPNEPSAPRTRLTSSFEASPPIEHLKSQLLKDLEATTSMSVARWKQVEGRLVFVHDGMSHDEIFDVFLNWDCDDLSCDEVDALPNDLPARETFSRLNQALHNPRRFEKLETLHGPIEADVYAAPARHGLNGTREQLGL
jgi:hypothetical protein